MQSLRRLEVDNFICTDNGKWKRKALFIRSEASDSPDMGKPPSRKSKFLYRFPFIVCFVLLSHVWAVENKPTGFQHTNYTAGRKLQQSEPNCMPPAINDFPQDFLTQAQRLQGGVIFHIFISCYICYALAIVCDDYFVPSLAGISEALHLPSDVAGATFMAAGTSAPELFTSVIGAFITEGDIGVGTIVGSAVFNILAVVAFCGLLAKVVVPLDWWPLTRDCLFYTLTVIALIIIIYDEKIFWYEAVVLLIMFFMYIAVMYFNTALHRLATRFVNSLSKGSDEDVEKLLDEAQTRTRTYGSFSSNPPTTPESNGAPPFSQKPQPKVENAAEKEGSLRDALDGSTEEEDGHVFSMPYHSPWAQIGWVIMWPVTFLFYITIPDCRTPRWRNWYLVTFFVAITYIGTLTYLVSWMVTIVGHTFSIPDTVMGLTFLAAGTSVPEAISSVIVTNQGFGNMAISNSVGSNIFDILFCLGLPWLIKSVVNDDYAVHVQSTGLEYSVMVLLITVVFMFGAIAVNRFQLNRRVGLICLVSYLGFLVISSLFELNIFGQVNLPTCLE